MGKTYRVGLVGCGRMGTTIDDEVRDRPNADLFLPYSHAAAVVACDRTDLVAVSDPFAEKAQAAADRYDVPTTYTDAEEMIRKEGLDVVCIATRPSPHAPVTIFAAENGVGAVYCEKPLCNSPAEADAMTAALAAKGVLFNYGTQRRYVALYQRMRSMVEAGDIGDLQAIVANCGASSAQWGHTHTADMLLYLSGDADVDFVQGTARFQDSDWDGNRLTVDPAIEQGYVRFATGVHGYLVASGGYEFEISGSEGKLRTLSNGIGYTWRRTAEFDELVEQDAPAAPIESGTLRAIEDLVTALDGGSETMGGIDCARLSQEIIFGLVASHRADGRRVELPLADRDWSIQPDNY
ncbi:MAG: Gfo/Idh/MocA family oxidoreductase [Candidatus Latescibacteria bacterium]|nr:Gfo/Idh/MocA family oxidoreductase [Candidatus Latescibacterota bacterium]